MLCNAATGEEDFRKRREQLAIQQVVNVEEPQGIRRQSVDSIWLIRSKNVSNVLGDDEFKYRKRAREYHILDRK